MITIYCKTKGYKNTSWVRLGDLPGGQAGIYLFTRYLVRFLTKRTDDVSHLNDTLSIS
jgi:hypothetical protein